MIDEARSAEMLAWAEGEEQRSGTLVSSDLLRTEAIRACRRSSPLALEAARERLDRMALLRMTTETYHLAGELQPPLLRSLEALHIAAALTLGDDLEGIVTYDSRMAQSARALGLAIEQP
jgi:predicted nucleic acid-binding protein